MELLTRKIDLHGLLPSITSPNSMVWISAPSSSIRNHLFSITVAVKLMFLWNRFPFTNTLISVRKISFFAKWKHTSVSPAPTLHALRLARLDHELGRLEGQLLVVVLDHDFALDESLVLESEVAHVRLVCG